MNFKETLQRYHISPLKYSSGETLNEKDYVELYLILSKYFIAQNIVFNSKIPSANNNLLEKVVSNYKRSLIKPDVEDVMDALMEQKGELVI